MIFQLSSDTSAEMIDIGYLPGDALRRITPEQLLYLGMRRAAYLRTGIFYGRPYFMLHGADGVPLEIFDTVSWRCAWPPHKDLISSWYIER